MDIAKVHSEMVKNGAAPVVKAGWVEQYLASPITFWCSLHAPPDQMDPEDPFQQKIFDSGIKHQAAVVANLYPGAVQKMFRNEEEGFSRCLELLAEGAESIQNMPVICRPKGLEGRPDLLTRDDTSASRFGDFSYRVVEIKWVRRLKESHRLQGALYNRILGEIQGYEPPVYHMVNRDHDVIPVEMASVEERLDEVLAEIHEIIAGKKVEACHGAARWPWTSYVDRMAVEANDVSLVGGVGASKRVGLVAAGFSTVREVASAQEACLTEVRGIGPASAKKFVTSAKAIEQGRPLRRSATQPIRQGKTEVFFDFEGVQPDADEDPLDMVNYLIGVLFRTGGKSPEYREFFAPTFEDEDQNLRDFLDWAGSLEDPVFYHWGHYERTHLKKMVEHYGADEELAEWVFERMVDLSPWVTKAFAFPCYNEKLKSIAKALGFSWRQDDVTGTGSMTLYLNYVESGGADKEARRKIVVYNEDDCLATMHIFDWMAAQRE